MKGLRALNLYVGQRVTAPGGGAAGVAWSQPEGRAIGFRRIRGGEARKNDARGCVNEEKDTGLARGKIMAGRALLMESIRGKGRQ